MNTNWFLVVKLCLLKFTKSQNCKIFRHFNLFLLNSHWSTVFIRKHGNIIVPYITCQDRCIDSFDVLRYVFITQILTSMKNGHLTYCTSLLLGDCRQSGLLQPHHSLLARETKNEKIMYSLSTEHCQIVMHFFDSGNLTLANKPSRSLFFNLKALFFKWSFKNAQQCIAVMIKIKIKYC